MKNYLIFRRLSVAIFVAIQINVRLECQTLLIENFEYPTGTFLTANNWNSHSSAGVNPVTVGQTGLIFMGYPSSEIGLSAILANTGEDVNRSFPTVTSGSVYCAFLLKVNFADNDYFLHLTGSPVGNNYKGRVFINGTGSTFNIGLAKGAGTPVYSSVGSYNTGQIYLLVLKYTIIEGSSNDAVSLYITDGSVPESEPVISSVGPIFDAAQTDLSNVSGVALRQYSSSQSINIDGIRIATRWEDAVLAPTVINGLWGEARPEIYPVPTGPELTVRNISGFDRIEISTCTGRQIIGLKTHGNDYVTISVSQLPPGVYFIRIFYFNRSITMKFIKI